MTTIKYVVKDELGLHARPAGILVKETAKFPCDIKISCGDKKVDAKRLIGIMSMGVKCGNEITLDFDGDQETEAAEAIKAFLEENL